MNAQNVYGVLNEVAHDEFFGHELGYASYRNGYGASRPLPDEAIQFEAYDGSDLRVETSDVLPADALMRVELEAFLYACAMQADHDPRARRAAEVASSFLEVVKGMSKEGKAFTGNTEEELDAVVEYLKVANPDAADEELVNIVYELTAEVQRQHEELIAAREAAKETTDSPQAPELRREVLA